MKTPTPQEIQLLSTLAMKSDSLCILPRLEERHACRTEYCHSTPFHQHRELWTETLLCALYIHGAGGVSQHQVPAEARGVTTGYESAQRSPCLPTSPGHKGLLFTIFQSFSQVSDLKLISKEGNQWEAPLDTWGYFSGALNCTHSLSHTHRPGVHVTVSPVSCCSWIFPGYQPRALVSHYRALGCKHHHSPHPHMQLCASQQPL